jgi:hypothetical protein
MMGESSATAIMATQTEANFPLPRLHLNETGQETLVSGYTKAHRATQAAESGLELAGRAWRALVWIESQIDWAEVGHIVWHGLLAFAVGVYLAGEFTGRWVHRTNDQMARLASRFGYGSPTRFAAAADAAG